jgi:hypothetical protein
VAVAEKAALDKLPQLLELLGILAQLRDKARRRLDRPYFSSHACFFRMHFSWTRRLSGRRWGSSASPRAQRGCCEDDEYFSQAAF